MSTTSVGSFPYGKIKPSLQNLYLVWKNYKHLCRTVVDASLNGGYWNCRVPCAIPTSYPVEMTALVGNEAFKSGLLTHLPEVNLMSFTSTE